METREKKYHLAIVGGGWSAASTIYHLIDGLSSEESDEQLNILILEKTDNLWTGVPYGNLARKDFFLIESLNQAGFPLFESWLIKNRSRIASLLPENSDTINQWYKENREKILQAEIDDIYFPRHIFGTFIKELITVKLAQVRSRINLTCKKEEVIDIHKGECGYTVITDKNNFSADKLVLATGSIPKAAAFSYNNYFSDTDFCSCFDYKSIFSALVESKHKSLAVIGASASALELLYCIAGDADLLQGISCIKVISNTGRLMDGYVAEDYVEDQAPEYVIKRRASDVYKKAIKKLRPKLSVIKGSVTGIRDHQGAMTIDYSKNSSTSSYELQVDVVVNCTGSSTIEMTSSRLIKNLAKRLPVTEESRGFQVNQNNEVLGFPGLFINGPLLNRNFSNRQVESIPAVFKESATIAKKLLVYFGSVSEVN
jgi:uncharacterized NAD(P)/FAD-binding protein YdhS